MLQYSRIRSFIIKFRRFVMSRQHFTTPKNAANCEPTTQASLEHPCTCSTFNPTAFVVYQQESTSRIYGQHVLNRNSPCRFIPLPQQIRAISTNLRQQKSTNRDLSTPLIGQKEPLRKWIQMEYSSSSLIDSFTFKLMSYNVLAQDLLNGHRDLYPYATHHEKYLIWDHRWNLIKQGIMGHGAAIICLQEVQASHYETYYVPFFKEMGYRGVFKQRTRGTHPDGCAIFYNAKALKLIEHQSVEYFQPRNGILNRDNIGIIAKFSPLACENRSFVVATTHLLYNPKREDVRLAQTQVLLSEINRIAYEYKFGKQVPVILCGDFNSHPHLANGVYQLITEQSVEYENVYPRRKGKQWLPLELGITNDCRHFTLTNRDKTLSRSEEESLILLQHSERVAKGRVNAESTAENAKREYFESGYLFHDYKFEPVFPVNDGVSTHQNRWLRVDHLFYSKSRDKSMGQISCLSRYELPTENGITEKRIKGIPNSREGSDHFSLVAMFRFDY